MIIVYIDILLLVILLSLTIFACVYCFYRVHQMRRSGQVAILLRPTTVLFSHKRPETGTDELRTVVAYQNPFTGDYCVHSGAASRGYVNHLDDVPYSQPHDQYPLNYTHQYNTDEKPRSKYGTNSQTKRLDGYGTLNNQLEYPDIHQSRDRKNTYTDRNTRSKYALPYVDSQSRGRNQSEVGSVAVDSQSERFDVSSRDYAARVRSPVTSVDSGLSDAYEPLHDVTGMAVVKKQPVVNNSVNKTWNWNYKEYQI